MSEFFSISLLIILGAISPGPDFALVVKNSLLHSRRAGTFTALGIAISLLIHGSYCVLGLALIIAKSLLAFSVIKYLGAAYLIYIGIRSLLAKKSDFSQIKVEQKNPEMKDLQAFRQGLLGNLLNPKAIMFLLAFFTLIVKPGSSLTKELGYVLENSLIPFIWFSSLAYLLTSKTVKTHIDKVQFYIVKLMGTVLIGFGIKIATLHQEMS